MEPFYTATATARLATSDTIRASTSPDRPGQGPQEMAQRGFVEGRRQARQAGAQKKANKQQAGREIGMLLLRRSLLGTRGLFALFFTPSREHTHTHTHARIHLQTGWMLWKVG